MIAVINYGSQYCPLIARRLRDLGYKALIFPPFFNPERLKELGVKALVLSGGPASCYQKDAPSLDRRILELKLPILGICYSHQLISKLLGGVVASAKVAEFGPKDLEVIQDSPLFAGLDKKLSVFMSHNDEVIEPPKGATILAKTKDCRFAAFKINDWIYTVQFHPEASHCQGGAELLANFVSKIAKLKPNWDNKIKKQLALAEIKEIVGGSDLVLNAISGGVDSATVALLLKEALRPNQVVNLLIENGLLRENEASMISHALAKNGIKIAIFDASKLFFKSLKGVIDPEQKRKVIGQTFIEAFELFLAKQNPQQKFKFLAQGTLYSDLIESRESSASALIKSHHNVGGLPEKLNFKLVEPLKNLFKDEVRRLAFDLGLDRQILNRHPFPGVALAVRVMGEVNQERVNILRRVDAIFIEELRAAGFYDKTWQAFAILLNTSSTGVKGDQRFYGEVVALRAVDSLDGMTAETTNLPLLFLSRVANKIVNQIPEVSRVVYDITSKPPATIEWE